MMHIKNREVSISVIRQRGSASIRYQLNAFRGSQMLHAMNQRDWMGISLELIILAWLTRVIPTELRQNWVFLIFDRWMNELKGGDQTRPALSQFHYCGEDDEMTDQNVTCNLGLKSAVITFGVTNEMAQQITTWKSKERGFFY